MAECFPFGGLNRHINCAAAFDDLDLCVDVIVESRHDGAFGENAREVWLDLNHADAFVVGGAGEEEAGGSAEKGADEGGEED